MLNVPGSSQILGGAQKEIESEAQSLTPRAPNGGESVVRSGLYSLRRSLCQQASVSNDPKLLKRWAVVEDWYGSASPQVYMRLLSTCPNDNTREEDLLQICRRGLQVSLREEQLDYAQKFAEKEANLGDPSGLDLVRPHIQTSAKTIEILGGANALRFWIWGKGISNVNRFFVDYSRMLTSIAVDGNLSDSRDVGQAADEYFRQMTALAALGKRVNNHFEILLTLSSSDGEQRTENVLRALGLKLHRNKTVFTIEWTEKKSEAKRQNLQAALAIDEEDIQRALSSGKPYVLRIPIDLVPIYPAESLWKSAAPQYKGFTGGLAQFFAHDPRSAEVYVALNSMDRAAADALLESVSLSTLVQKYSRSLALYSSAFALKGNRAEVPGGLAADSVWHALAGESPTDGAAFFRALLIRDNGALISFFHALSGVDIAHQRFFTASTARANRFYALFRDSPETRDGREQRLRKSTLFDSFRDIPLNRSGAVDFPGSREVWTVKRGANKSKEPLAKISGKNTATPIDDAILTRLATTTQISDGEERAELANLIAVVRIAEQRHEPLSPEAALLLSQNYSKFGALFPYLADLGDLAAADYETTFALFTKLNRLNFVTANVRLGELHSCLAMLCLIKQSGLQTEETVRQLYRRIITRYTAAQDASAWSIASLAVIQDLARLDSTTKTSNYDGAIRALLVGGASITDQFGSKEFDGGYRMRSEKAYQRILELQRVPSLDALLIIRDSLRQLPTNAAGLDTIQKQISTFITVTPPYQWKIPPDTQKWIDRCQINGIEGVLSKLRDTMATPNRDRADVEKLSDRLLGKLEPWISLAMAGQIYARFLDPSDLIVACDHMLLRKHQFTGASWNTIWRGTCPRADFVTASWGEGSYFVGGFADFSLAAGQARAEGNHLGGSSGASVAAALLASARATDWRPLSDHVLQTFGANVRLAREWIVESATSEAMCELLNEQSGGVLSIVRRKALVLAITNRDWQSVWDTLSVSDLFFLGKLLATRGPEDLWTNPALLAMRRLALQPLSLDVLGQIAPDLSGSAAPRLRPYQSYEEYERYYMPLILAQRVAELKLYLAWLADSSAWQSSTFAARTIQTTEAVVKRMQMRDGWDWGAALDTYRNVTPDNVELLLDKP
ncbi:MAG TPA: hypothetical protein VFA65_02945 [Bryobacteraceae bacterium]|nr:hypothetical protein [Bryobacteraceae bacterium]